MVAGKKIEIIKASSDAKPDVAVNATRKLVEQDKVQIMVGPLSGGEGIAVKDYAKTQPNITFINGSSGAQATTLVNPSENFFRFNTEGAQWMVGLGKAAFDKGYKRMMVIAEDYAFPYSQVQGFMTEYCKAGGKVPLKAWVPLGGKDYASVIARIPKDVDALLVVLGGADAVNFLNQYEQAGGDKPIVGGSITVSQDVLNYRGKRRESLLGTIVGAADRRRVRRRRSGRSSSPTTRRHFPDGYPSPSLFAYVYYMNMKAALDGLDGGERRPLRRPEEVPRRAVEDDAQDADRRRASSTRTARRSARRFVTEVVKDEQGRASTTRSCGRSTTSTRCSACRRPSSRSARATCRTAREDRPVAPARAGAQTLGAWHIPGDDWLQALAGEHDAGLRRHDGRPFMATVNALRPPATPLASGDALELEGVSRRFGALRAIDDVSLAVARRRAPRGDRRQRRRQDHAVQRHHRRLSGDAGRVRFFGDDVTALPPYERIRAGLRRTYQSSLLFRELTVRDNLFLAVRGVARGRFSLLRPRAPSTTRRAADDLLERVRLDARRRRARSPRSSHGQQRQLEIGMALAGAPRLILFDEPAAGLSPAERRELVRAADARCRRTWASS